MLSVAMIDRLNRQIQLEQFSSNLYLQMSAWCDHQGYTGSATFLREHAGEELVHMHKLFDYVCETGALAIYGLPMQFVLEKAVDHNGYNEPNAKSTSHMFFIGLTQLVSPMKRLNNSVVSCALM